MMTALNSGTNTLERDKPTQSASEDIMLEKDSDVSQTDIAGEKDIKNQKETTTSTSAAQDKRTQEQPENAAIVIQSAFRGYLARRELYAPPTTVSQKWNHLIEHSRGEYVHKLDASGQRLVSPMAWRRAQFLISKVGRGSGDIPVDDALLLLTEHWLEMTDEKHRYGSNLKAYHEYWLKQDTTENFFYWLDHGEGRQVDLAARPREKLEEQLVSYLLPYERERHVVQVQDGLLVYKATGEPVHTLPDSFEASDNVDLSQVLPDINEKDDEATKAEKKKICRKSKYIYVTDTSGTLYVGKKIKGQFHHSSFLGGGAVCSAGGIVVNRGKLIKINPKSGHYRPQQRHFEKLLAKLQSMGLPMEGVTVSAGILKPRGGIVTGHGDNGEFLEEVSSPVKEEHFQL